jgi:hypothetical protein
MTYYEEFGVATTASQDEIRQAYRHLSQLVHPDHCGDAHMRRLADLQMKRLSGMADVLLDPASRECYDRSLMPLAAAVAGESTSFTPPIWDWRRLAPATIAIAAGLLILILGTSPPAHAPPSSEAVSAANAPQRISHTTVDAPPVRTTASEEDWEPLATYAYESHLPIPPIPFPIAAVPLTPPDIPAKLTPAK